MARSGPVERREAMPVIDLDGDGEVIDLATLED